MVMTTTDALFALGKALNKYEYPVNYLRLLARHVGFDYLEKERELESTEDETLQTVLGQLQKDMPVEYIIGFAEFYGREFMVSRDTLIPRPLTESIVETALEYIGENSNAQSYTFVDIGTGTGCVILSVALEIKERYPAVFSKSTFIGSDISNKALEIAKANAKKLNADFVTFIEQDGIPEIPDSERTIILSNPPYIPPEEMIDLPKSVASFEPYLALSRNDSLIASLRHLPVSFGNKRKKGCVIIEDTENGVPFIEKLSF
mgnify:CR=1 FL=1